MKGYKDGDLNTLLPGSATQILPTNIAFLDPGERIFSGMLQGWECQQKSRHLNTKTINSRIGIIRRFYEYTETFPWDWKPGHIVEFSSERISQNLSVSSIRHYQNAIRLFLEYITDIRYGWVTSCQKYFGVSPIQICDEWNTVTHSDEYEGNAERRPFTYDELDQLFAHVEEAHKERVLSCRKGSLAIARDVVMLKVIYAFGLRRREACRLELSDLRHNPALAMKPYGRFGALHVRYGKAVKGGPPRRRTVLTVPECSWVVDVLQQYLEAIRPKFRVGSHPALFVTERAGYVDPKELDARFKEYLKGAGLPEDLTLHFLRHTYTTNLVEYGYDPLFVQQQLGHRYASSTAIYSHVGTDFKNQQLRNALQRLYDRKDQAT